MSVKGCVTMMTIRELADRCEVHYNTMRKWLIDNKVPKANESRNAPFILSNKVIEKAETHFLNKEKNDKKKKGGNFAALEKDDNLVSHLVSQIDVKDIQIVKQQEQIDHLQKLLENQQILTLKAQEKVNLLENKDEKENYEKNDLESDPKEKLTFWKRIFKIK